MQYDNSNSGVLFKNINKDKPGGNRKWPDYKGQAEVNGVQYWISSYINESKKDGSKFMSLKFTRKDEEDLKPKKAQDKPVDDFNDDIPF